MTITSKPSPRRRDGERTTDETLSERERTAAVRAVDADVFDRFSAEPLSPNANVPTTEVVKGPRMARGQSLESTVLASQTDVLVTKIPNGARWIGRGKFVPVPTPFDFFGAVRSTGRIVVFDAKQCGTKTSFNAKLDHVQAHQRQNIIRYGQAGAIAGFLVEATALKRYRWLPWGMLLRATPTFAWDLLTDLGPTTHAINWKPIIEPKEHP